MRGRAQVVAGPLRAVRLRREQMRGHPLGRSVLGGEQVRRPLVAGRARRRRQLLVNRAADDRVDEPQRACVGEDAPGSQRVGGFGGLVIVQFRERGGVADERAVADDRRRAGQPLRRLREAGEPRPHRRDDALGSRSKRGGGAGVVQRADELA